MVDRSKDTGRPPTRAFWGWLLALLLAAAVVGALERDHLAAMVGQVTMGARGVPYLWDPLAQLGRKAIAFVRSREAQLYCKPIFAFLMFAFAFRESIHMAKVAWRRFRAALHKHRARVANIVFLALILVLCAGPIYYLLEIGGQA